MYDLSGKVALVAGTDKQRGLGRQIALRLAREGADLIVSGRSSDASTGLEPWEREQGWLGLPSLVAEIRAMGRRALAIPADVASSSEVNSLVAKALGEFGNIDILVNNAAVLSKDIGHGVPLFDLSEEMWNRAMGVNLTGVFLVSKAVAKNMIERGQGGRIINIASLRGKEGAAGHGAYSASKFGAISVTQTMAIELGRHRITVNAVCPGLMMTWSTDGGAIYEGMTQGMSEADAVARAYARYDMKRIPLGRPGTAEEVANVVVFLASNQSEYITGQAINVDGGRLTAR